MTWTASDSGTLRDIARSLAKVAEELQRSRKAAEAERPNTSQHVVDHVCVRVGDRCVGDSSGSPEVDLPPCPPVPDDLADKVGLVSWPQGWIAGWQAGRRSGS